MCNQCFDLVFGGVFVQDDFTSCVFEILCHPCLAIINTLYKNASIFYCIVCTGSLEVWFLNSHITGRLSKLHSMLNVTHNCMGFGETDKSLFIYFSLVLKLNMTHNLVNSWSTFSIPYIVLDFELLFHVIRVLFSFKAFYG